jgi:hypothetical protein
MISFLKKSIPLTFGLMLTVFFILFLEEFVNDFSYSGNLSFETSALPFLIISVLSGIIGIPLFLYGLGQLNEKEI